MPIEQEGLWGELKGDEQGGMFWDCWKGTEGKGMII